MAGIIHKVKDMVTGHKDETTQGTHTGTGTHSGQSTYTGHGTDGLPGPHHTTAGPHSSDLANRADPRVDSDRDGRTGLGSTGSGLTGSHHHTTAGPHSSDLANRADPRVDSDRDGRTGLGSTGVAGLGSTGSGLTGSHHHTTAGPHSSDLANRADPRVDSDRDGRTAFGSSGITGTGSTTGANLPLGVTPQGLVHGHHTTVTGEKLDPHVSGTTTGVSSGITTGTTGTSGTSGNTTGSHNSSLLNKLDPRVDSDRDGSRTTGGGSYAGSGSSAPDVRDAARSPPSVFAKANEPIVLHDDPVQHRS